MRCFTVDHRMILTEGIVVSPDPNLGYCVVVGEKSHRMQKMAMFKKNPAEVVDNIVYQAHPVPVTIDQGSHLKTYHTLARPNFEPDTRILIYFCSKGVSAGRHSGYITAHPKELRPLISGFGTRESDGVSPCSSWIESIYVISKGQKLIMQIEGDVERKVMLVYEDKNPELVTYNDK